MRWYDAANGGNNSRYARSHVHPRRRSWIVLCAQAVAGLLVGMGGRDVANGFNNPRCARPRTRSYQRSRTVP